MNELSEEELECAEHRATFDREVREHFGGCEIARVAAFLHMASVMHPPQGSLAKNERIMANACDRAAAEIRRLRTSLAERDELLAKAGEHIATLLKWCPAQRGEWMDNDSFLRFKELRDEAVLFAAELKEKQP